MSFDTKDGNVKSEDDEPLIPWSSSGSCRPLSANTDPSSNTKPVCKVVGAIKKKRVCSTSDFMKVKNVDNFNERFKIPKGTGVKNSKCLFYELDEKEVDLGGLTRPEIDKARKTGALKLNGRLLQEVPEFVWSIELPTDDDRKVIDVRFDGKDDQHWWTFRPLEYLDISHNSLQKLSPKGSALYTLKELHANNNSITKISNEIGQCKELKILSLHENNLEKIPDSMSFLKNLTELQLQKNNLYELPDHFGDLYCLKKLDVSFNRFAKIPCNIGYLTSLVELNFSHNQAKILPEEIQGLRALEVLDVSNNHLNFIPSLNEMSNLKMFFASNNNISDFPNFYGCRRLTEIRLENNQLKVLLIDNLQGVPLNKLMLRSNIIAELPEDISRISTLVLLDISSNQIKKLPHQLAQLRNLSQLIINDNPIEDIRQDILKNGTVRILAHLRRLSIASHCDKYLVNNHPEPEIQTLYEKSLEDIRGPIKADMRTTNCLILSNLELSTLSQEILLEAEEERVFRVDLSRNKFFTIPEGLQTLSKNLTEIIIKQNNLRMIPDFIGKMKCLLHLDISNNKVETLPSSMKDCNLKGLIAECNCFTDIPEVVYSIKSLEHLNFGSNKICDINVEGLKNLKYLFSLDLSNNNIQKVPPELGYLLQVKELSLFGNPFKFPRYSLLSKGTEVVMAYLRDKTATHDC